MKRLGSSIMRSGALIVGIGAVLLGPAFATERVAGNNIVVPEDRIVRDDFLITGNNVLIQSRVIDDVVATGNSVVVGRSVTGDITAAGANVLVSHPVGDDLRAFGANVTVTAPVTDKVQIAARKAGRRRRTGTSAG